MHVIFFVYANLYIIHHGFWLAPFLAAQQQAAHENAQAQVLGLRGVPGERSPPKKPPKNTT